MSLVLTPRERDLILLSRRLLAENERYREMARKTMARVPEMQAIMRREGLAIDDLDDPTQKLAFTFYTELCEAANEAEAALSVEELDEKRPTS